MTQTIANPVTEKGEVVVSGSAAHTVAIETVGPELAEEWLGRNSRNRTIKPGARRKYARDIAEGRWEFTGETVKFADDGTLLDGQHRLLAILDTGATLPMVVVRGLDKDSQTVMDTGSKRSPGDALALDGEQNPKLLASVAALAITDGAASRRPVSNAEIAEAVHNDSTLRWITGDVVPTLRSIATTPSVIGYTYWRLNRVDVQDASQFFNSLASLVGLPNGSPILALNRRLSSGESSRGARSHAYRRETIALIFMAWNAWRKNEARTIIKLAYTATGSLSVPEPK